MRIVRERPSQRLQHRVTAPLWVAWRDQVIEATDWSLSGLRLDGVPIDGHAIGDQVDLRLSLPFQGFDVGFVVGAEVVRTATEMVAFRLVRVGERERSLMAHFIDELVRGSMVEVADTIQRIDVPVTPVSTRPDPNPKDAVPVRRWPVRAIVMTTIYLMLGAGIIAFAGFVAYANMFKLEVDAAVVTAPLDVVTAHADGRIMLTELAPGDRIEAGQTLGRLADSELEHSLDVAAIAVERARARRDHVARQLDAATFGNRDREIVADNNRERTAAAVAALEVRLELARARHDRVEGIYQQGWTTVEVVEEAANEVAVLEAELAVLRIDLGEFDETASETTADSLFDAVRMEQGYANLAADLMLAEEELLLARQELEALEMHRQRLDIAAPFDGWVVEVSKPAGATVLRGDDILIIERDQDRTIEAFLDQEQILVVGLGDTATVYLPALDRRVSAWVTRIDRTTGFIDEQRSHYSWRGPEDRSGRVILTFTEPALGEEISAGLPAIVIFDRRSDDAILSGLIAWIGHQFAGEGA